MDHLATAVVEALTSGYCPTNKGAFLEVLAAIVAVLCAIGIPLIVRGKTARVAGLLVVLFAIGFAAINLFGFFGCGAHTTAGLTRDWPW